MILLTFFSPTITDQLLITQLNMSAVDTLSPEDKDFLDKFEEELKHRYTEKDEEFMKIFNAEPSKPPIIESWWVPQHTGRRNDKRNNRRNHPYERQGNRDRNYQDHRYGQDRRDSDNRGYKDYGRGNNDRGQGYYNQQPRY